ncbi:MAG: hypothetical protein ABII27_00745 [bacterium]
MRCPNCNYENSEYALCCSLCSEILRKDPKNQSSQNIASHQKTHKGRKNSSNITLSNAVLIIICFILVLLLGDLFFFGRHSDKARIQNDEENKHLQQIDTMYTQMANEIENMNNADPIMWKIFGNDSNGFYGFQFSYPPYFREFFPPMSSYEEKVEFVMLLTADTHVKPIVFRVYKAFLQEVSPQVYREGNSENIKVAGIPATRTTFNDSNDESQTIFIFEKDYRVFFITGWDAELLQKIMDTFVLISKP